jgi:hypothetical protein
VFTPHERVAPEKPIASWMPVDAARCPGNPARAIHLSSFALFRPEPPVETKRSPDETIIHLDADRLKPGMVIHLSNEAAHSAA